MLTSDDHVRLAIAKSARYRRSVIFKQKEKERVEKRNKNRGKEERGKAVFLLKSVEK